MPQAPRAKVHEIDICLFVPVWHMNTEGGRTDPGPQDCDGKGLATISLALPSLIVETFYILIPPAVYLYFPL